MTDAVVICKTKGSFVDIICKVREWDAKCLTEKSENIVFDAIAPFIMQVRQNPETGGLETGLHALTMFGKGEPKDVEVKLNSDDILFTIFPSDDIEKQYRQQTSRVQLVS